MGVLFLRLKGVDEGWTMGAKRGGGGGWFQGSTGDSCGGGVSFFDFILLFLVGVDF